jgi:hypothetical protein
MSGIGLDIVFDFAGKLGVGPAFLRFGILLMSDS